MGKNKAAVANQKGTRGKNNQAAVVGDRGGSSNSVNNNNGDRGGSSNSVNNNNGGGAGGATYGTNKMCWDIWGEQSYHINNSWGTPGGHVGSNLKKNKQIYFPTPTDDPKVYPSLPYSFGNPVVFSDSDIDPKFFN